MEGSLTEELPVDQIPRLKAYYAKQQFDQHGEKHSSYDKGLHEQLSTLPEQTLQVTPIKNVKIKSKDTGRWITYTAAKFEKSETRVSSTYVAINHHDTSYPQFGQILRLYFHSIAEATNTIICEINIFGSAYLDTELQMWHCSTYSDTEGPKRFLILEEISPPLIVSIDKEVSRIWFINYTHNNAGDTA